MFCPARDVLVDLTDRWSLLVIRQLSSGGRLRHKGLRDAIPDITPKVLGTTLQRLQARGLVRRFAFAESPPRVEYKLTPDGLALAAALEPLWQWASAHHALETPITQDGAPPGNTGA